MGASERPPSIERAVAQLPTIGAVLVTAVSLAWFLSQELSSLRQEVVSVRVNQQAFAAGLHEAKVGQAALRREVAAVDKSVARLGVKVEDLDEESDERAARRRARSKQDAR